MPLGKRRLYETLILLQLLLIFRGQLLENQSDRLENNTWPNILRGKGIQRLLQKVLGNEQTTKKLKPHEYGKDMPTDR